MLVFFPFSFHSSHQASLKLRYLAISSFLLPEMCVYACARMCERKKERKGGEREMSCHVGVFRRETITVRGSRVCFMIFVNLQMHPHACVRAHAHTLFLSLSLLLDNEIYVLDTLIYFQKHTRNCVNKSVKLIISCVKVLIFKMLFHFLSNNSFFSLTLSLSRSFIIPLYLALTHLPSFIFTLVHCFP